MAGATPSAVLLDEESRLDWSAVDSSNLDAVAYSDDFARLWVRFLSGSVYAYLKVPRSVYDGLLSAGSKGEYLNLHVKKAGYGYIRVR